MKTKEELSAYNKAYREKKRLENPNFDKMYRDRYKVQRKESQIEYRKTEQGKKSYRISNWKLSGLIDSDGDNYEALYEHYINTNHCDVCLKEFIDSFDRCMDHNHDTGLFRQILCQSCNTMDRWKLYM